MSVMVSDNDGAPKLRRVSVYIRLGEGRCSGNAWLNSPPGLIVWFGMSDADLLCSAHILISRRSYWASDTGLPPEFGHTSVMVVW